MIQQSHSWDLYPEITKTLLKKQHDTHIVKDRILNSVLVCVLACIYSGQEVVWGHKKSEKL